MSLFRRSPEQRRQKALRSARPGPLRTYLEAPLPDLGTPLAELRLLAVDIETTVLDPRRDRVLSIGWLPVDGGRVLLGGAARVVVRDEGEAAASGRAPPCTGSPTTDSQAVSHSRMPWRGFSRHWPGASCSPTSRRSRPGSCRWCASGRGALGCRVSWSTPSASKSARWPAVWGSQPESGALRLWAARERRGLPVYRAHEALVDALACAELDRRSAPSSRRGRPERPGAASRPGVTQSQGVGFRAGAERQIIRLWLYCAMTWTS